MRASVVAAAARPLMEHFERLSEAPGAVGEFRRLILDLAVRGKLVEQDGRDEPAGVLLKRIAAEKARLVAEGEIKKGKASAQPLSEVPPFGVPKNWTWTQLAEVGQINPRNDAPDDIQASFVPMPLISAEYGVGNRQEVRVWSDIKSGYTHFAEGDVGLAKITPCFENGKSTVFRGLTSGIGAGTTELHIVRPLMVNQDYILIFLKSPFFVDRGTSRMTGTAGQKRVPTEYFAHSPFPLPPLAEQKRIVAKVDQLMALCDRLEAAQSVREYTRDRLAKATLQKLNTESESKSPNPPSFRNHAQFFIHHLPRMSTRPEHIAGLRQSILNLAVRGKLVEQDARDEPAGVLLKRIAAEKARLVREEIGTHSNPESFSRAPPFDIPTTWRWVCVGEVADSRLGKMLDQAKNKGNYRRYLRNVNVRWYNFDLSDILEMRFEDSELEEFRLRRGDVLICEGGEPGRAAVWDERETDIYFQKAIHRVRLSNTVDSYFFVHVLKLSAASDWLAGYFTGTGIKHLTGRGLASFRFPLPPLAEQKRIVAKVDQLMTLCDQLEQQISTTQTKNHALLKAILQKINTPTP